MAGRTATQADSGQLLMLSLPNQMGGVQNIAYLGGFTIPESSQRSIPEPQHYRTWRSVGLEGCNKRVEWRTVACYMDLISWRPWLG
jgi:hypothetical protein